jgi:hypothetical protein
MRGREEGSSESATGEVPGEDMEVNPWVGSCSNPTQEGTEDHGHVTAIEYARACW